MNYIEYMKKEKIPFGFKSERVFRTAVREHVDIRKSLVEESRNQIRPYKVLGEKHFNYSGFKIHWTNPAYLKLTHELVKSGYKESEIKEMFGFRKGTVQMLKKMLAKEGGKIFGSGSRTPIAITFLVKNNNQTNKNARIYYSKTPLYEVLS